MWILVELRRSTRIRSLLDRSHSGLVERASCLMPSGLSALVINCRLMSLARKRDSMEDMS